MIVRCAALLAMVSANHLAAQSYDPTVYSGASATSSRFIALRWRNVGPFRGGRAVAVTGDPTKPLVFYFGTAKRRGLEDGERGPDLGQHHQRPLLDGSDPKNAAKKTKRGGCAQLEMGTNYRKSLFGINSRPRRKNTTNDQFDLLVGALRMEMSSVT